MNSETLAALKNKIPSFEEPKSEREALKSMSELTKYAHEVIRLAESYSEKFKVGFNFSLGNSTTYYQPASELEDGDEDDFISSSSGWISSSERC